MQISPLSGWRLEPIFEGSACGVLTKTVLSVVVMGHPCPLVLVDKVFESLGATVDIMLL
jgi:hypothetical protein